MKKEIINRICKRYFEKDVFLRPILEEELHDFSRIDEERFKAIYDKDTCSGWKSAIQEYNSTLPPALVPLPKEMPYGFSGLFNETHSAKRVWVWITDHYGTPANNLQPLPGVMPALWHDAFTDLLHKRMQPSEFYSLIIKTYGTHEPKQSLPTVEELEQDILGIMKMYITDETKSYNVSKHLKNKYSLHPREWWKDAIPYSTQFKYNDTVYTFSEYSYESSTQKTWIHNTGGGKILCSHCTPYTPPSAQDIIKKHNLSEEEVKAIREGK